MKDARAIIAELKKFSADLAEKERWLVLNKLDLLPPKPRRSERCKDIVRRLRWKGPVYRISGLARQGTDVLCQRHHEAAGRDWGYQEPEAGRVSQG